MMFSFSFVFRQEGLELTYFAAPFAQRHLKYHILDGFARGYTLQDGDISVERGEQKAGMAVDFLIA